MNPPGRQDIFTEAACVEFCLQLEGCNAIAIVYEEGLWRGCHPKSGGWNVTMSDSNITSADVECLRILSAGRSTGRYIATKSKYKPLLYGKLLSDLPYLPIFPALLLPALYLSGPNYNRIC